jgi:acetylornithine deacetylase/succinyl-diaminopimelate desuccinylase-like protein
VKKLFAALAAVAVLFLTSTCREAGGVPQDPMDREAEDTLVAYLKIDTTNPPGNETEGAVFLRDILAKDGIPTHLIGTDPRRQAVYARLTSGTKEKALLLLSHIDVVPADAKTWQHPPFGGMRANGYLWGRGALDIKSLTVAQLMSVLDLKRRHAKLKRDVIFLAVPDEERGGEAGIVPLLQNYPELFANVGYVMNEGGSNETAVDRVVFWGIEVQQKLPLWLRVTTEGPGGHGAAPPDHGGATAKLVRAMAAVDALETPYRVDPEVQKVMAATAAVRTDGRGAQLRLVREPLNAALIEKELSLGSRSMLRDTIAITYLNSGSAVNSIPTQAVGEIDIRLLPSSNPEVMIERIREAVGKDARVDVLLSSPPVPASPWPTELFDVIAKHMRASSPGSTVGPYTTPGTTDSRFFRARGVTAYGVAPFKVNYYDAETVHGQDERIRVRFFVEGVHLMREIVRDFCADEAVAAPKPAGTQQ